MRASANAALSSDCIAELRSSASRALVLSAGTRLSRTLLRVAEDRSRNHQRGRANECFRPHELISPEAFKHHLRYFPQSRSRVSHSHCRRRGGHIHPPWRACLFSLRGPQAVAPSGALLAPAGASNPNGSKVGALALPLCRRERDWDTPRIDLALRPDFGLYHSIPGKTEDCFCVPVELYRRLGSCVQTKAERRHCAALLLKYRPRHFAAF